MALSNTKKASKTTKAATTRHATRKAAETVAEKEPAATTPATLPADAPLTLATTSKANRSTSKEAKQPTAEKDQTKPAGEEKIEIIDIDQDEAEDVQEVHNDDKNVVTQTDTPADEAKEDEEDDIVSVDFSDFNTDEDSGVKGFITNHWNGLYPEPEGKVAKLFAEKEQGDQIAQIELLINVNPDREPPIFLSDFTDVFTPFVTAVPGMGRHLKVIYNLQHASAHDLFKDTKLENELVCLTGDYIKNIQLPTVLVLPKDGLECKRVKIAVGDEFNRKRVDATGTKPTWFLASRLEGEVLVPSIMPVPAFLLYDAFDGEIDSMILYERWMNARTHNPSAFPKFNAILRAFLKAQVVTPTSRDPQTRLPKQLFIQAAPSLVNEWKKHVLEILFKEERVETTTTDVNHPAPAEVVTVQTTNHHVPASAPTAAPSANPTRPAPVLANHQVQNQQPNALATTQPTSTGTNNANVLSQQLQHMTLEQLVAVVSATTRTTIKETKTELKDEEDDEGPPEQLGMCKASFERLMTMCGLSSGEESEIPELWKLISGKKMKAPMKKSIIRRWIEEHEVYPDAKVIIYSPLVTMIQTRDFEEETSRSSRKSAAKGLTPFAVPSLSDKQVDTINDHAEAIESATQTTVKDMATKAIKAEGPKSFWQLTKLLRRYNNLIYALFGAGCPLYSELSSLISSLDSYGDEAIRTMSVQTMVTITWLVHLQSRHFAAGKMDEGEKSLLGAFSIMCVNVAAKQPVVYGDVPYEMYASSLDLAAASGFNANGKRGIQTGDTTGTVTKKPKIKSLPHYHHLIKEKMSVFSNHQKLPRIKALCEAANCKPQDLFPKDLFPIENFCQKSALFGTCFADCRREHAPVTDEQAKHIITKLKKALDEPDKVKVTS